MPSFIFVAFAIQGFPSGRAVPFVDINFIVAGLIIVGIIEANIIKTTLDNSRKANPTTIVVAISYIDVNKR